MDFALPADHKVKLKESEKKNKYLDLARELNKQWNMKVMMVTIVISTLCIVRKGFIMGLKDFEIK